MDIQVQTLDGRMPSQGGVRTGYWVNGVYTPLPTLACVAHYRCMGVPPKKKVEVVPKVTPATDFMSSLMRSVQVPKGIIVFDELPWHDGSKCVDCGHRLGYQNVKYEATDRGQKEIVTCPACLKKMRVD